MGVVDYGQEKMTELGRREKESIRHFGLFLLVIHMIVGKVIHMIVAMIAGMIVGTVVGTDVAMVAGTVACMFAGMFACMIAGMIVGTFASTVVGMDACTVTCMFASTVTCVIAGTVTCVIASTVTCMIAGTVIHTVIVILYQALEMLIVGNCILESCKIQLEQTECCHTRAIGKFSKLFAFCQRQLWIHDSLAIAQDKRTAFLDIKLVSFQWIVACQVFSAQANVDHCKGNVFQFTAEHICLHVNLGQHENFSILDNGTLVRHGSKCARLHKIPKRPSCCKKALAITVTRHASWHKSGKNLVAQVIELLGNSWLHQQTYSMTCLDMLKLAKLSVAILAKQRSLAQAQWKLFRCMRKYTWPCQVTSDQKVTLFI